MIIGYSGEGANDKWTMEVLCELWCGAARLEHSHFRGSTGEKRKHEIRKACIELCGKGAALIIFYTDANGRNFRDVQKAEWEWVPDNYKHLSIYAVGDRNVECWMSADKEYTEKTTGLTKEHLKDDPSEPMKKYFGSYRDSQTETNVKNFVRNAPLKNWLENSDSFDDFYMDCKRFAAKTNCPNFPNLKEN